jgi:hypothetical protein
MAMNGTFDIASSDELWVGGVLIESRRSHGRATHDGRTIRATDRQDAELMETCSAAMRDLRRRVVSTARVRLVTTARRAAGVATSEATMTVTMAGISAVTNDPLELERLLELQGSGGRAGRPLVWRCGSGAVLLHEAVGHAAEHDAVSVRWPSWLRVRDEPDVAVDDCGNPPRPADLTKEQPSCFRRESFRDIPMRRMSNLVATAHDAPFALPEAHVDVYLVAGGAYDPLTDMVSIDVAISSAGPFSLRMSRAEVAGALAGAFGEPERYPGVICSREGQEVSVGSRAPVLLTR